MKSLFIFLLSLTFSLNAAEFSETRDLTLNSTGIKIFEIDCGAGFLEISGTDNSDQIVVEAEIIIHADEEDVEYILSNMLVLYLEKRGSSAELKSTFRNRAFNMFDNLAINLKVFVPHNLELDVDDGSGYIKIKNTASDIRIDDGSGSIKIENVSQYIEIDDGSGDIDIINAESDIEIDDGSGTINAEKISGNLDIDDGSGALNIMHIKGNVTIDDGSGSINVDGVSGDVIVEDDGTGSVNIRNVDGVVKRYDD